MKRRSGTGGGGSIREIVGSDPRIVEVRRMIRQVADSPATVLIQGDSGSGKELVVRALHRCSRRSRYPFVAINCAAIPETLLESELFGHEKGAYTGAGKRYLGRIEKANGGTLFLDEVDSLALSLQAKLLRFLQFSEIDRLGSSEPVQVDARIAAATCRDLKALAAEGRFHASLFYRLNVVPILLPSLRQRAGDIPRLIDHFADRLSCTYGRRIEIEPEVYRTLSSYPFPGNVRELENLVHRLLVLSSDGIVRLGDLPPEVVHGASHPDEVSCPSLGHLLETLPADLEELRRRRDSVRAIFAGQERRLAERALCDEGGNLTRAARRLGIHRVSLHRILSSGR